MPAKGIVEALPNRQYFVLVTNTTTNRQRFEEHKVLGHLNDHTSIKVSAEAAWKSPQNYQSLPNIVVTISTEEKLS